MKIKGKVFVLALALIVVMALLAGCGGGGTPAVSDDPNVGIWQAVTIEMFGEEFPADEIYSDGFVLELKDGGKCELRAEGKKDKYDWSATGDTITVSSRGTAFISAAVSGNVMVIEDFMGTGLKIVLEKEGADQGAADSANDPSADGEDNGSDAATDAAAYFSRAELEGIYDQLSQDYDERTLSGLSYQEVFDRYFDGVEGTLYLEGDVLTIYQWPASDDAETYVTVSFQDYQGDGNRTAGGIGSYFP